MIRDRSYSERDDGPFNVKPSFTIIYLNSEDKDITAGLLRTNRQVHSEAEPILYENCALDFEENIQQGDDFLQSISEVARLSIRSVSVVLLYFHKLRQEDGWEFSYVEDWVMACQYFANNLRLRTLNFDTFVRAVPKDFQSELWVKALVQIQRLQRLEQRPSNVLTYIKGIMVKEGEGDKWPNNILEARLTALLRYLKSKVLAHPASHPETDDWKTRGGSNHQYFSDDEEPN